MTDAEEKYKAIINRSWPDDPAFFQKHPKMPLEDRAKIFAPFAALRGHNDRLLEETGKLLRSVRPELSEEEAASLSDRLSQLKKGMMVTITYFLPDSDEAQIGYCAVQTGTVTEIDPVYRILKIAAGQYEKKDECIQAIPFDDLLTVSDII
ncbi:MAG: YolD-like family protein [Lachnospiraceae bacterium]|nr:YolD-like family protein [Lachnospiraceae bacterium]